MGDPVTPIKENRSEMGVNPSSSSSTSSSLLNLPSNMSRSALSLETPSSSSSSSSPSSSRSHIDRLLGVGINPSPSRTIYSDRFIPSRSASNFALFDISPSSNSSSEGREDGSGTYATLLRTVLFGPDLGVVSPITPEKSAYF
ncbi:protein FIZZY-RELATED 1-like [Macadamia integrifolia]|uniref:protein FIZZY-RELATED 1-like n=1 Tax=Macadamia integrifolia TaxID=60698 RepID=UPI001C4F78F7|nr:protein FIZZY-RELATED 1-like [Macadamia integrifolia]